MVVIQIPSVKRVKDFPSYVEIRTDEVLENLLKMVPEENRNNVVHGGNNG
jgi:hypothetical protein